MDWVRALTTQLDFYWETSLRPRLEGLTDEEFFWEPVEGCWSLRPGPDGDYRLDGAEPEPSPPPVTTIAWRILHIAVGVFHTRASTFFGDGRVPADATMFDPRHWPASLPGTAAGAVELLESSYRWWRDGVAGLDEEGLLRPLGPRGVFFAEEPMAMLVLHLNRETFHHGGEIGTLRDLYRATGARSRDDRLVVR
ncbi:DinB family protein [Pseudosporangium ferrugineum]|uniref:DinB family protein n=1 Tax=Pseudosporangium ferrugineum TaxID=439699 RepID=A0A2T0S7S8_9ACTN|nr:DinB family protein [Pseudosporangium ferrugineum]PRY29468.1 DinB family protein [Pseudosporangium ferrugineum]